MQTSANLNVMVKAARKAGRSLMKDFQEVENLQVSVKGAGDFVTQADIAAENIIKDVIKNIYRNLFRFISKYTRIWSFYLS